VLAEIHFKALVKPKEKVLLFADGGDDVKEAE
jgi:hypothetical protein